MAMKRAISAIGIVSLLVGATSAQDSRLALFDSYNNARTYEQVQPLVSGVLAQQFAAIAGRSPQQVSEILMRQQLSSYRPRFVEIDASTSFLVLEHVAPKAGQTTSNQAYLLTKSGGAWTLANRLMPDSIIKALWTRRFDASEFAQSASCVIDGREFVTRSALAIRRGNSIDVTLYPFEFTAADVSYWRQLSGLPTEALAAESHFSQRIPTVCRAIVKIDAARPSLLNVGFDDQSGGTSRSTLWQPPPADVSHVALQRDVIELTTAGALGLDRSAFRWNMAIKVPVWEQGL